MNVKEKTPIVNNHSVEWGESTWDSSEKSIRNRYDTSTGGFNYAGSGEIPWEDFKTMISESINRGQFSNTIKLRRLATPKIKRRPQNCFAIIT